MDPSSGGLSPAQKQILCVVRELLVCRTSSPCCPHFKVWADGVDWQGGRVGWYRIRVSWLGLEVCWQDWLRKKALATQSDDPSSLSKTHIMEGENLPH